MPILLKQIEGGGEVDSDHRTEGHMENMLISQQSKPTRRGFLTAAALAVVATGFPVELEAEDSVTGFNQESTPSTFPEVRQIKAGTLDIGYIDRGPADGPVVLLLHGWPYDIHSFAEVTDLLVKDSYRVIVPHLRGYGTTRFLLTDTPRNAQPAAFAVDVIALMDALGIKDATVGGFDWGARTADIVASLWPERCTGLVSFSGYLVGSQNAGHVPLSPAAELQWWYQFYFATDRGKDGYDKYRRDFARLIWKTASPKWAFSDETFERSATSFDNVDHTAIVIHNYRWRLGLAQGESKYDEIEAKLASAPTITVPTITLEGDANGAPHLDPKAYRARFTGKYESRVVSGGVGHNLPQEAPEAFAKAVLDVTNL